VRHRVISEILAYIEQVEARPAGKREYQARRTTISRARSAFRAANPRIDIGSFKRTDPKSYDARHRLGPVMIQWGGRRYSFRPSPALGEVRQNQPKKALPGQDRD
jgi:hypothetical protein